MGRAEPFAALGDDIDGFLEEERVTALQAVRQVLPFEELHHQERQPILGLAEVEDVDDVRLAKLGGTPRFPFEARHGLAAIILHLSKHLDGHATTDGLHLRCVHRSHAAAAQHAIESIAAIEHATDQWIFVAALHHRGGITQARAVEGAKRLSVAVLSLALRTNPQHGFHIL